jgi:hypothetical protein
MDGPIKVVGISIAASSPGIRTGTVRHWARTAGRSRHGRRTGTISRWRGGSRARARCSDAKGRARKPVLRCGTNLRIQHPFTSINNIKMEKDGQWNFHINCNSFGNFNL